MILVLGGSGYVGSRIVEGLAAVGLKAVLGSRNTLDYYDCATLSDALRDVDFLINAAGYTGRPNVDACELHKSECLQGNAVLPGIVRQACESQRVPWIHISSGCIFSGTRDDGAGFNETDPPNFCFRSGPCSFYSGCKALGEELLEGASDCYVLRLRIPFEAKDNARNYISKLMRYDRLLDATNSLTLLDEFVAGCLHCIQEKPDFGVYNLTNGGAVTTRDVVSMVREFKVSHREFTFFESETEFMQLAAKTPRSNCVLDNSRALSQGFRLSSVPEALQRVLSQWQSQ